MFPVVCRHETQACGKNWIQKIPRWNFGAMRTELGCCSSASLIRVNPALPKPFLSWLHALVKVRSRRGSWAYLIWLLVSIPPLAFLGRFYPHASLLLLLVPIVIGLAQAVYPTILGWLVILIPSALFTGIGFFYVILTAPGRFHEKLGALVVSSVAMTVYLLVCVSLWRARPKLTDANGPKPNIPPP